jgi:ubiquinone biosynthesis accessory factor UbiJ
MLDPAAALANRVFERQAWAQERLAGHAGRVFVVAVGPLSAAFSILASGRLEGVPLAGTAPDLTLTVSPIGLPSFLASPARWAEFVTAAGDPALAATLQDLAHTLPWFVEETFAGALGPVVGQRIADAGRRLLAFPEYAAQRFSESVASYARDEAELVAGAGHLADFSAGTAALATRVDALTARIDALAARIAGSADAAPPDDRPGANVVTFPRG